MDTEMIKVITFNCWGVFPPLFCEKRVERLAAVGEKLAEGEYDIILFQELYITGDYTRMREALKFTYPYSNYFHSMTFGSGCCIFTKYKIKKSFFFPYSLNGYMHQIKHGDFYAGKGAGLCVVETQQKYLVNVYVTHMHARYEDHLQDSYSAHRLNQAFELSQLINLTGASCNAIILGGDFNMNAGMTGFDIIVANTGLKDSWITQEECPKDPEVDGATSCRPDNTFCCPLWLEKHANGERLDYIFYKQNNGYNLKCVNCQLALRKIPTLDYISYSDHEAVSATFQLCRDDNAKADPPNEEALTDLCRKGMTEFNLISSRYFISQLIRTVILCCLFLLIILNVPELIFRHITTFHLPTTINQVITFLLSVSFYVLLWYTVVLKTCEQKMIFNAQQGMNWIINDKSSNNNNGYVQPHSSSSSVHNYMHANGTLNSHKKII